MSDTPTTTAVAPLAEHTPAPADLSLSVIAQARTMDEAARVVKALATSRICPDHLRGDNGAILTCIDISQTIGCSLYMVMQSMYSVHGRIGFSGQFCIAALNRCPQYRRIEYRYLNGSDCSDGMQVIGHRTDGETDIGCAITPSMVKAEGWSKNSKWQTMADQMYRYRAASFFVRAFCPEALMGFQTADEIHDLYANGTYKREQQPQQPRQQPRNVTPAPAPAPQVITPTIIEETDELPLD